MSEEDGQSQTQPTPTNTCTSTDTDGNNDYNIDITSTTSTTTDATCPSHGDDNIDDSAPALSEEEIAERILQCDKLRLDGNELFKAHDWDGAACLYSKASAVCPPHHKALAAVLSNRAACMLRLERWQDAIDNCTNALEVDSSYLKALMRRAQAYEQLDKLDEALKDYKAVIDKEPMNSLALEGVRRLPPMIEQRNEAMKAEMLGKLKDLGNKFLGNFGLSTDNFNMSKDPSTGNYSFSMNK